MRLTELNQGSAGEGWARREDATVFDCTKLPIEFVGDTGEAAFIDAEACDDTIRLPAPKCLFIFSDDINVIAREVGQAHIGNADTMSLEEARARVRARRLEAHAPALDEIAVSVHRGKNYPRGGPEEEEESGCFSSLSCRREEYLFFHEADEDGCQLAIRLLGVLALLGDKLVADEITPDPFKEHTKRRQRMGLQPLSGKTHVLTVNVGEVRRAARNLTVVGHESPCLHWRRGHPRVLHRGSEFEKSTWINRMLVGDPDKGFASKSYRLVHNMPLISPAPTPEIKDILQ